MGICLETEKKDNEVEEKDLREGSGVWFVEDRNEMDGADGSTHANQQSHVKFETPKIPVIFVLGGPGSGKVTHCDNLADEKQGVVHINMSDLLQQYAVGADEIKDSNQLSSKIVSEVLMLEMKMSPAAKTFLVSGYPRNMRDVVEYSEKIKTVSGVLLLSWKKSSLERQIEYGAKLGHVVLGLARMELNNFYKHVVPVADFYDQRKLLVSINGERNPAEVYNDFRVAVLRIIGSQRTSVTNNAVPNGKVITVSAHTHGEEIPMMNMSKPMAAPQLNPVPGSSSISTTASVSVHQPPSNGYPSLIYVIGGPGSNKGSLIRKVLHRIPGWIHISTGELLRGKVDARDWSLEEAQNLRDTIAAGEMVEMGLVNHLVDQSILSHINTNGIVLDGYPRDLDQLHYMETKYNQHPPIILLDCSKLQLSRGRWDDSVAAFRKRLEMFREKTLPMLKVLDTEHRLTLVDGDTDTPETEESFTIALCNVIQNIDENMNGNATGLDLQTAILQDLEDEVNEMPFKPASQIPLANGYGPPNHRHSGNTGSRVVSVSHAPSQPHRSHLPREN
ncbi:hypothetical protein V9T40_006021 [Parthenolecanium corni]|uniref:Adenylate kinase isoenzyme 5 n=1 Tax=Parthenolecanium corni TaxID=536013 RepID=A0AAN9YBI4_9HEMI